jgi:hypothetical protein
MIWQPWNLFSLTRAASRKRHRPLLTPPFVNAIDDIDSRTCIVVILKWHGENEDIGRGRF